MTQSFEELITGVCAILRFEEPERLINGESIFLNDVMFTLIHDIKIDPNRIFLFASFGELPRENSEKVLEELLKQNHACFAGKGPGFTVSPTTGKIVYSLHVTIAKTMPRDLANKMAYLMKKAKEWRETFFLDKPAASRRLHFIPSAV